MEHLSLEVAAAARLIAAKNEKSRSELGRFLAKQVWTPQDRQCILSILAQLLLDKDCTVLLGRQLRPFLLDLLERNAEAIKTGGQVNHDLHERLCVSMSKLIGSHPDVLLFALRYFRDTSPVFQRLFLESSDANPVRYGRRRMKLRDLMEAAYKFLQQEQSVFRELWDWSVCVPLLRSHDTLVRWYTANCLALITCMSEEHKLSFLKKIFSSDELIHFRLRLLEEAQLQDLEKALLLANPEASLWHKENELQYLQGHLVSADLSSRVTAVCGVVLPRQQPASGEQGLNSGPWACEAGGSTTEASESSSREQEVALKSYVLVESVCKNLQMLAMAVASQNAVLLEGPIGCGKTSLVEYLATVTGRRKPSQLLKVQLGDQTDSKMLLGMYRCTDVPGEFVWQPGTLTQAATKGHWILLEDIDYAPLDVVSVLIPLLENGELLIPGCSDCLKVAPGFQFFATRRLLSCGGNWYRPLNSHATLLDKYWTKIHLDNLDKKELSKVLQSRYPSLLAAADHLLEIYVQLTGEKHHCQSESSVGWEQAPEEVLEAGRENKRLVLEGRELSLRDLLNWCNRIAHSFESSSSSASLHIFQEALDCFTAMLSEHTSKLKIAEIIGSKLNISKKKAEFFCQLYKPEIVINELDVQVGRVRLLRKQSEAVHIHKEKFTFAATRPSSVLIEQLAVCVSKGEPVLLVGETGTGKTSTVQYLAHITGHRLRVVNMNQQSDTADLLGGYKPVDHKLIWLPLRETFEELFAQTFSRKQNFTFLGHIQTCYRQKRWHDLLRLMQHVYKSAVNKEGKESEAGVLLKEKWEAFGLRLNHAQQQMKMTENSLLFAFVEGTLAQAVKKGEWILLDEINLAAPETLECLSGLLEGSSGSLVLLDRGDTEPLVRHPDFHLFACMNPATDVGKRNLPPGIRNRFTELYIEELESKEDLQILIVDYLKGLSINKTTVQGIINFYSTLRKESGTKLVDGTGHRPHYSLRTLCRALRFAASNPCSSIQRSLYEGFCLGFLTQLDRASRPVVQKLICQHAISGNVKSLLKQPIPEPKGGRLIQVEGYWISVGDKEPTIDESYVLTSSVKLNLRDIVRVVSAGTYPVLIQGETSVGKTSLIRWLAAATGNHCVRINNHEHTDIQEYIGCYTSDCSGKLVFKEGVLIDAMRKGYWIILDELNLAPTDVLEALNRLLDDNRELLITETQEVVKAHPRFMLFATQNPPGLYGGRKVLSRAFRNRFVELHFDELPSPELETILHKRCSLPPSYCTKLVKVMLDLQSYRRSSSVFAGKQGFITLRDLFRWAERYRLAEQTEKEYDWLQHLANDGFMLLAGRVRKQEEVYVIQEVLEKHFKKKLCPQHLFSQENVLKLLGKLSTQISTLEPKFSHIVWTEGMRRLAILVGRALEFGEPVLLVGDTGCGKTTICQIFAALKNQKLYSVNCHLNMETSDFLGGLRPVRQRPNDKEEMDTSRLFEWHDGPLVLAMKEDSFFLLDEISLADDSVLERLNSVLEIEKSLVLAEKGSPDDKDNEVELLTAGKKFRILATMNPGGDFGKKELSPALRNRFTEIWCPQSTRREDLIQIINRNLHPELSLGKTDHKGADIAEVMLDFIDWLTHQEFGRKCVVSIRDILSWVNFMNIMCEEAAVIRPETISTVTSFVHAACLVYIDGIGSGVTSSGFGTALLAREECLKFLIKKISKIARLTEYQKNELKIYDRLKAKEFTGIDNLWGIHPFFIPRGPVLPRNNIADYALSASTTAMNAQRLLRATKLNKPILLEGSPGVGKTSLVGALAKASGNTLVRINLSEQTDITDLFGADLPVEGGKGGEFAWRDGPLLAGLKAGHWIVLDELNLASQSVLEGLNACFDHRGEIYVPELGMTFQVQHEKTKIFGCQNPFRQGGGRKGLPRSFLNRFTQVFVDPLTVIDMEFIASTLFPAIDKNIVKKMVAFNNQIDHEVTVEKKWGQKGGPWEFNLRDLFRWCQLMLVDQSPGYYDPGQHVFLVYGKRMRTRKDKEKVVAVFKDVFGSNSSPYMGTGLFHITPYDVQLGYSILSRGNYVPHPSRRPLLLLHQSFQSLESIMKCVQMSWMVILVGSASVGKTSQVQLLAHLTGHTLKIMAMNSAMDTTELLGGFEQVDLTRPWRQLLEKVEDIIRGLLRVSLLVSADDSEVVLRAWSHFLLTYKPKCFGEDGKGITMEIVNKLEAVLLLMQRLNNKINSYSKAEFAKLLEDFRSFGTKLMQSATGCNHGTFEWVDSMLVQALKSGDWLLMDNVNLCNPSVLDRLNALLEPGGVLAVNERGMIDGSTMTITPHPNFRLFLSMDPVHGEISRAMRNRGLEIYISGEENETKNPDKLDLKVLLHNLGLVGDSVCDILLALHSETQSSIIGSPTSSVSALIQAAMLIVQYLQRGLGLDKAFSEACWEVYVHSQYSAANQKLVQALLKKHVSFLKARENWGNSILAAGLWPDSVPSAVFATEDSHLSVVRSDGQILAYCLNRMSMKTKSWARSQPLTLQDLEKIMQSSNPENLKFSAVQMDASWIDEPEVLAMAVKLLIERATNQDWMLRVKWLYHLARNIPQGLESIQIHLEASAASLHNFFSNSLSAGVTNVFKILQTNITDDFVIPLDPRWNMQALDIIRNSMDFDPQTDQPEQVFALLESLANKTIIYLDREKRSFTEANLVSIGSKTLNSVLRMSFEFHKDPESYHSLPHEIVVNLAAFFELCDALILLWVQSPQGMVSDANVHRILDSVQWRDRFWTVADAVKVDVPGLALLALHWHWVLKHLVLQIPQLLMNHEDKYYKEVQTVSEHIQNCLDSPTGGFTGIKKLQKFLGRPFPFKDKLVIECFSQLKVLNKALAIREWMPVLGESGWQEDIHRLQVITSEWTLKKSLLQAWGLILRANILEDVNLDELKNIVSLQCSELKAKGLPLGFLEKKAGGDSSLSQLGSTSLIHLTRSVQLWPAMEYLAILQQYKVTADFMTLVCLRRSSKNQQPWIDEEISHHITFCLKHTPMAPQELLALWSLLHYKKFSAEEIICLWSELFNSTFTSFWSSSVTTNPEFWLTWNPLLGMQQKEVPRSPLDSILKGPGSFSTAMFSKCCFEVLTNSCRAGPWDVSGLPILSSSHVTLGEWVERVQQLQDINSLLWTNMAIPSVAEFRRTDSQLQGLVLCRHLMGLSELLPEPGRQEYMQNCEQLLLGDSQAFQHICQTLGDLSDQAALPKELLCLLLTSLHYLYGEGESKRNLPEPAQRGSLWVNLGLLQIQTWLPQARFDPAVRREYKLKYAKEELHQLQCEQKIRNLSSQLQTGRDLEDEMIVSYSHPHVRLLHQRIEQLENSVCRLLKKQAFRPQLPAYESLVQEIYHYVTSIAKADSVQDLLTRLLQALMDGMQSAQVAQSLLKEEASWQQSHHQFRKRLGEEYALYPDIVTPLQASILQLQHGMRLVASEVHTSLHSTVICTDRLGFLATALLAFPSVGPTFPTYYAHADALCLVKSEEVLRGLGKLIIKCFGGKEPEAKGQQPCPTREQLLMNALLYLHSHVLCKGELDQRTLLLFRHVCQEIINEWDEQERVAQEKVEKESSLYKSRSSRTALSEEEEEEWEFRKQFPLHEKDFADILVEPVLEEKKGTSDGQEESAADPALLSQSSMQAVMLIHQQLCLNFSRSLWYQQQTVPSHETKHYLSLFLSCYQTGASLVTHFYPLMGVELNDQFLGSQLLACTLSHNTLSGEATSDLMVTPTGPYDFYQHPNVPEARQCQPVLQDFSEAVSELLQDWPEHPALEQLLVVMDRIRTFPLSSPISKFLNGLEILLAKAQDWEENASRALSLHKHISLISQMIIRWRKLELNCWSMSLDNTMKRHTEKSTKHWFSIYQMLEKHMQEQTEDHGDDKQMTLMLLVSTLQAFIEGSSLGEFHVRLQMLLVFHCHVLLIPQIEGKDSLCSVLWNLYHYYEQFFDRVQAKIVELRSPLEKELKEFVKISRWNDVSFWSIKQSVEKTHRTLFKFMKKFEAVLSEPCRSCLVESDKEEQADFLPRPADEVTNESSPIQCLYGALRETLLAWPPAGQVTIPEQCPSAASFPAEGELLHRLPKLTKRMRKICLSFMKESPLPHLVEGLDQFIGEVISSVSELQSLKVEPSAEKEKQRSEAKHILMLKQRALSDLFKHLAKTGLSYRKGLTWARSKNLQELLHLHPLDLRRALSMVSGMQEADSRLLAEISSSWDGCQKYFYRSLARHTRLNAALATPAKEMSMGNIERCKGFSAHLMKILIQQRRSLTTLTEQWIILRNLLSCVQEIDSRLRGPPVYPGAFPPQDSVQQWTERLQHVAMQSQILLEQLSWFFQCCPNVGLVASHDQASLQGQSSASQVERLELTKRQLSGSVPDIIPSDVRYPSPVPGIQLPSGCQMRKQDQLWQESTVRITEMLKTIKTVKADVDKIRQQSCETLFHSWKDFEVCSSGLSCLSQVSDHLRGLQSLFIVPGVEVAQTESQMTLIESLEYVKGEIDKAMDDFTTWKTHLLTSNSQEGNPMLDESFVEDFSEQIETAIRAILCAIQNLAERNSKKAEESTDQERPQEEEAGAGFERLQPGHLTKLLEDDFWADVSTLHVQKIISAVSELLEKIKSYGEDGTASKHLLFSQSCCLLVRLVPMLCSFSDLTLFFLTMSLATHRSTAKLLSVLAQIFTELAQKGFCLPKEFTEDSSGEGATEFHNYEGGGIGEGEGMRDVSDKIENEEQVEDSFQKGQEKDNEEPDSKSDIKGEDNAIEMSEDFEGKMHDGVLEEQEDEDDKSDTESGELDKQMGDLSGEEADKLDERLWGDDDDDEDDEEDNKTEETGPGMDEEDSELVARDDNLDPGNLDRDKNQQNKKEEKQAESDDSGQSQDKINEQIDEREYDENEVDPYHGNQEKLPEPEALDLPDKLDLDSEGQNGGEDTDSEEGEEENPLEIKEKSVDTEAADHETEEMNKETEAEQNEGEGAPAPEENPTGDDKVEGEEEMDTGADNQDSDSAEHPEENSEEQQQSVEEELREDNKEGGEKSIPVDQGLQSQEEEGEKSDTEEQEPEATERKEHSSCGQTGVENVQSAQAVELAGAAPEKEQGKEEHGSGTADANQAEGHESNLIAQMASQKHTRKNTQSFKRKPGQADNERSIGDYNEHVHKRLRTVDNDSQAGQGPSEPHTQVEDADAFEHIKQGSDTYDAQTYDVASKEQQQTAEESGRDQEEETENALMDLEEPEELRTVDTEQLKPDEVKSGTTAASIGFDEMETQTVNTAEEQEEPKTDLSDKETVGKKPERSQDSSVHTAHQLLMDTIFQPFLKDVSELRQEMERQLETWQQHESGNAEEEKAAAEMWQRYLILTAPLSQELCEQLRLILEPTQAAKLKGDYRTGKRLNMRKVIPYIASQFRKDKIWLRRTKPSKRQYQICLAIDDSSSMVDNHTKQLAFESLAVIGNALTLLEVGQIAVCSFGESVKLLHPFYEQFSDYSGAQILRLCKFQQKKTKIAQFLESVASMFAAAQHFSQNISPEIAQLLLIVSDGRGLFLEGKERVLAAVQAAQNANIFVIFVVLDSPSSRDSILDIKVPIFKGPGEMPEIRSYMEEFPFPFYIILRDVNALPETLSDALRQWFELVTASDHP